MLVETVCPECGRFGLYCSLQAVGIDANVYLTEVCVCGCSAVVHKKGVSSRQYAEMHFKNAVTITDEEDVEPC